MKNILLTSFLLIMVGLGACRFKSGSGVVITEDRTVGQFSGIDIAQGFDVVLTKGPSSSVRLEADDNIISLIRTEVVGDVLKIRLKKQATLTNATLKAYISTPFIRVISASSGSKLVCADELVSDNGRMDIRTSSSGHVECRVNVPEIELKSSSGSSIYISGRTRDVRASASSGSGIYGYNLLSEKVYARSSSGSSIELHASVSLDAGASSGSSVRYRGGAGDIKSSESSGGSVSRSN